MDQTVKPKMRKDDRLLSPHSVAKKMEISIRSAYDLIEAGYFERYYPNGPGKRPVRVWESSVIKHIESFTLPSGVTFDKN